MKKRYDISIWLGDEGYSKTYIWVDENASPKEIWSAVQQEVLDTVTFEYEYSGIIKEFNLKDEE